MPASKLSRHEQLIRQANLARTGTDSSYCLTDEQLEARENIAGYVGNPHERSHYRPAPSKLVGGGAWVIVTRTIGVNRDVEPVLWGIYWATPCRDSRDFDGYDPSGRYKVDIVVQHRSAPDGVWERVSLFANEYTVIPEDMLQEEIEAGHYSLQSLAYQSEGEELTLELLERGRDLVDEERDIIRALQLDGLTETEACQEYFFTHHVEKDNHNIWFKPSGPFVAEMERTFGRR